MLAIPFAVAVTVSKTVTVATSHSVTRYLLTGPARANVDRSAVTTVAVFIFTGEGLSVFDCVV